MIILGISAGFHDAAVTVTMDDQIVFAGHSERYSKKKNDADLCLELLGDAMTYWPPDVVSYYEKPWLKKIRQLYSGEYNRAFDFSDITIKKYLKNKFPELKFKEDTKFEHHSHHLSHAAASFQTSPFSRATVVVIDAIGEWDTISIYGAEYDAKGAATYKTLWKHKYPHSIGLFYSAITEYVGLKPMEEEYILMGMAAYGEPIHAKTIINKLMGKKTGTVNSLLFNDNLHIGVPEKFLGTHFDGSVQSKYDVAASAQSVVTDLIEVVMRKAKQFNWSSNLVYCGGVALNCSANEMLGEYFNRIWVMPNPGDAGSSLGACALSYGKKLKWEGPYLGREIPGPYPVDALMHELLTKQIVGVASGKAEFGPRALGNRSLLADPRGHHIKDKVNEIKKRQKFRPFAPVILEEFVNDYFDMPDGWVTSPYMQVIAKCKQGSKFPAIIHADGTSRVQTVSRDCKSGIRQLLEAWYKETGCPMLLNTSLNIRGEPMVNDRHDADRFEEMYKVKVLS